MDSEFDSHDMDLINPAVALSNTFKVMMGCYYWIHLAQDRVWNEI
jgi:hypothetical protein